MAVHAAVDIVSLDADIFRSRTAVSPPFGWPKQADDRRPSSNRDMRRTCVAANVNTRAARQ